MKKAMFRDSGSSGRCHRFPARTVAIGAGVLASTIVSAAAADNGLAGGGLEWPLAFGALLIATAALAVYAWRIRMRWKLLSRKYRALKQEYSGSAHAMQKRSATDGLTGLANRRSFDEAIEHEWQRSRRHRETLALLMIDIDHFKKHNDNHGHQAGDECLRLVARLLASTARRAGDLPARYGGEEFVVLLPASSIEGAVALAERIRVAVEQLRLPYLETSAGRHVSVSIGVAACVPDHAATPSSLVAAADGALYQAKAVGRNQVIVASAALAENT